MPVLIRTTPHPSLTKLQAALRTVKSTPLTQMTQAVEEVRLHLFNWVESGSADSAVAGQTLSFLGSVSQIVAGEAGLSATVPQSLVPTVEAGIKKLGKKLSSKLIKSGTANKQRALATAQQMLEIVSSAGQRNKDGALMLEIYASKLNTRKPFYAELAKLLNSQAQALKAGQ